MITTTTIKNPCILLVDDKPGNLFVLEKLLSRFNVKIIKATSGNEALALALQEEPMLVLLDVQMPEMDGFEVLELMRMEKRLKSIPVIFVTAYHTDSQHQLKGYELGAVDYLYKPIDDRVLLSKVAVFLELYEQKRENRQLQQLHELILNSAGEGIFGLDSRGYFNFANPAAAMLLGHDVNSLIGNSLEMILPMENYDWKKTNIYKSSSTGFFDRITDGTFFKADGSKIPVDYIVTSVRDSNNDYLGVVVVFSDATARKLNEQTQEQLLQFQKMEAIGQLTGGIAHDFNNLLTTAQGNLEIISSHPTDEKTKRHIDAASNAITRGAELTKRLLAFARKQTLYPKSVNLYDTITNTVAILRPTIGESITIDAHLPDDLWPIWVDPSQFENVIMNLSINARDAMPNGGTLTIEAKNIKLSDKLLLGEFHLEAGEYVKINITDSGSGMSPEVQEHIFEPFFTTKEVGKGTGLGLSMIYGFMQQSKGYVTVSSELGHGTTFELYIPRAAAAPKPTQTELNIPMTHESNTTSTILVVEDEQSVLELVTEYLQQLGYSVLTANTGAKALEVIRSGVAIDLVFSDVIMPGGMTGLEVCKEAKKIAPHIKFLLSSGYPQNTFAAVEDCNNEEHYLAKPYKLEMLARKIREMLEKETVVTP